MAQLAFRSFTVYIASSSQDNDMESPPIWRVIGMLAAAMASPSSMDSLLSVDMGWGKQRFSMSHR